MVDETSRYLEAEEDGLPVCKYGPQTAEKLDYLRRYVGIFTRSMHDSWPVMHYIDLFAGSGKCRISTTGSIVLGSPLLALTTAQPFAGRAGTCTANGGCWSRRRRIDSGPTTGGTVTASPSSTVSGRNLPMATRSDIEWTESTWNPVTGCTKVSAGCKHCYAERMAKRLQGMGLSKYASGFKVALHESALSLPLTWTAPQMVFVNSMSDLFHEEVPDAFIYQVLDVIRRASWHVFQVLTKRAERLWQVDQAIEWPTNLWLGVSVESSAYLHRIERLQRTHANIKFLSLEPLLGPLPSLDLRGIDWVIVGGESGPGARAMAREWVLDIRDQCVAAGVPFFFKQWGGMHKKHAGRLLEGRTWDEWPACAQHSAARHA